MCVFFLTRPACCLEQKKLNFQSRFKLERKPILTLNFLSGNEVNIFYRWFSHLCFICTFRDYIKCIFFVGDNFSERTILILNNTLFLVWNCVSYESHRDMSYLWHLNRLDALWLDTENHDFVRLASEGRFVYFRPILSRSAWNSASD